MASAGYTTNVGLPALPLTQDGEAFKELLAVYRAIAVLQGALDQYTGIISQPQEAWPYIPPQAGMIGGNLFRLYKLFDEAVLSGQMVALTFTNTAVLAGAALSRKCRGYALGNVAAGQYGEIICFGGTITYPGTPLTAGDTYWLGNALGTISAAPGAPLVQPIGFALTSNVLSFQPVTV